VYGIFLALRAQYESKAARINEFRIACRIERHEMAAKGESTAAYRPVAVFSNRAAGAMAVQIATSEKRGEIVRGTPEALKDFQ
jgi:hypothetical protein